LYSGLNTTCRGVLLVGPAGSGKTSCYRVLSKAMNILNGRGKPQSVDGTESVDEDDISDNGSISSPSLQSQVYLQISC